MATLIIITVIVAIGVTISIATSTSMETRSYVVISLSFIILSSSLFLHQPILSHLNDSTQ